jgi:hypothetical protein
LFGGDGFFRSLFVVTSSGFFGSVYLNLFLFLAFFGFFFIIREFFFKISSRRNEGAGRGIACDAVSPVVARGNFCWISVSGSIATHVVQGIQIQSFIPGAGKSQRRISSSPCSRMPPLAQPVAGVQKPVSNGDDVVRN